MKYFKGLISLAIAGMIIGCGGQVNSANSIFGVETVKAAEILNSGSCGDNVTYVLTDDGTLTISGSGSMYSYDVPWGNYKSFIQNVEIRNGVTTIGKNAFRVCSGLTSVTIPDSVTSIGEYAFRECSGLTSVEIPDSVKIIGETAFYECSGLTSVTIPNSVISIGEAAFLGCSGLTSVEIPNSVTSIDWYAFCECSGLTSVTIPDSVTSIGRYVFKGCSGLSRVSSPCKFKYDLDIWDNWADIEFTLSHGEEAIYDAVAATCTTAGKTEGSCCSECYEVIKKQETVPAKGHTEVKDNAVAATCTTAGKTEGSHCSECNAVIIAQKKVTATGNHTYGSWNITQEATAFATGKKEHKCTVCGKVQTETIAKLNPTIKLSKTKATIKKGKSITIKVSKLAKGDAVKSWKTSNKKIATVKNGKIKAIKKGKATITVTLKSGKKATVKVTVK